MTTMPASLAKTRDEKVKYACSNCYKAGWNECYAELLPVIEEMRKTIKAIYENTLEVQPNSGHMYLANVNYCYKKSKEAIAAADKILGEK